MTLKDKIHINYIYLILGGVFLLGIILLIIGNLSSNKVSYDNTHYYITLKGDNEISIYQDSEYIEPGYEASDSLGHDLSSMVVVDGVVDVSKLGSYTITYILNDVKVTRNVTVMPQEVGKSYIYLFGDLTIYVELNNAYVDPGYQVIDTVDGSISKENVKVVNDVDISKPGIYKIIYTAINSSGITTSAQRTVVVMDSDVSLYLDNEDYTNGSVNINIYVKNVYFDYMILPNGEKIMDNKYAYSVSENGNYQFKVFNSKGSNKEYTINVVNINRTKPTGSCSGSYKNGVSTINMVASDDVGIKKYVTLGNAYVADKFNINGEYKSVLVTIYDMAGNSIDVTCNLTNKNSPSPSPTPKPSPTDSGKTLLNVKEGMHRYTNSDFVYYLYFPPKATTNLPVILWLHGDFPREEWTADNQVGRLAYEAGYPAILVAPFGGDDFGYASNPGWYEGGLLPKVKALVDEVCKTYKCDKNNINVGGHSRGAIGTWQIVNNYPGYFHAASPISCCSSRLNGENFKGIKLWAMRGSGKGTGYNNDDRYSCMQSNVNTVKDYVKAYRYVIKPNKSHGDMANSFDQEYFDFMFSK